MLSYISPYIHFPSYYYSVIGKFYSRSNTSPEHKKVSSEMRLSSSMRILIPNACPIFFLLRRNDASRFLVFSVSSRSHAFLPYHAMSQHGLLHGRNTASSSTSPSTWSSATPHVPLCSCLFLVRTPSLLLLFFTPSS